MNPTWNLANTPVYTPAYPAQWWDTAPVLPAVAPTSGRLCVPQSLQQMQSVVTAAQLHLRQLQLIAQWQQQHEQQQEQWADEWKSASRQVSPEELLAAMTQVVTRAGAEHHSQTTSTMLRDASGLRCIQGELLLELGATRHERLPATWRDVAAALGHRPYSPVAKALQAAQGCNDSRMPWGQILERFRAELGLAA